MPLPLPNLDDKAYAELVEEAIARIPHVYEDWTDHNPSDPGITVLELLAWLTELSLYRVNQVPDENYRTFLQLLSNRPIEDLPDDLDTAIHEVITELRTRYRAVTADDYAFLATDIWQAAGLPRVARAVCFPRMNLAYYQPHKRFDTRAGHISVAILPDVDDVDYPVPNEEMLASLDAFYKERRTLTTRHHVVAPEYVPFSIRAVVKLHPDYLLEKVETDASTKFYNTLHPIYGGASGKGWAFGRDVFVSEMIQILDGTEGVDYVRDLEIVPLVPDDIRRLYATPQRPERITGMQLNPIELPAWLNISLRDIGGS
ncbi:MAG: baseplate protein J [Chloroflexota bacterium]